MTPLLDVQDLTVVFAGARPVTAVDRVSFQIMAGETLGLVGESGSGKSVTAFSILRLVQPPGRIAGGRVLFEGRDLLALPESEMRQVRGARISRIRVFGISKQGLASELKYSESVTPKR